MVSLSSPIPITSRLTIRNPQACIHPQVGALGAQAAGGQRALGGGVIRPIGDVLTGMVDVNWQAWMTDKKSLV